MEKFDRTRLENRLVTFASQVTLLAESLPASITGKYFTSQLIRSSCSPALNYGEACSAESDSDFIHKMKVALKELRETFIALKILTKIESLSGLALIDNCLKECNELISIFVRSVQTAENNRKQKKG
jgi:four helix bundle protein